MTSNTKIGPFNIFIVHEFGGVALQEQFAVLQDIAIGCEQEALYIQQNCRLQAEPAAVGLISVRIAARPELRLTDKK